MPQKLRSQTLNISLTPQLEDIVKSKVSSGLYGSASEVMREALRLLEERDSGAAVPLDIDAIKTRGRKRLAVEKQKGSI